MRKLLILIIVGVIGIGIFVFVKRSMPYRDSPEMLSAEISIDSIWMFGPAAGLYDKKMERYYWLKSYTSFDQSKLDTLKSKKAKVRYMKFLKGPFENRIFWMEVDSIIVFDQVVERE